MTYTACQQLEFDHVALQCSCPTLHDSEYTRDNDKDDNKDADLMVDGVRKYKVSSDLHGRCFAKSSHVSMASDVEREGSG